MDSSILDRNLFYHSHVDERTHSISFLALAVVQRIDIIGVTMPYTHDEDKWKSDPPSPRGKFDWLMLVIFIAILTLIYLLIRYYAILFPTILLPS